MLRLTAGVKRERDNRGREQQGWAMDKVTAACQIEFSGGTATGASAGRTRAERDRAHYPHQQLLITSFVVKPDNTENEITLRISSRLVI